MTRHRRRSATPFVIGGALAVAAAVVGIVLLERGTPARERRETPRPEASPEPVEPEPREVPKGAELRGSFVVWPAASKWDGLSIELPVATQARTSADEESFVEIVVPADRARPLYFGGELQSLDSLRDGLVPWAEKSRDLEHPYRLARQAVLVTADARVRWREVHWVMMACNDPLVRIHRIYAAARVTKPEKDLAVLPLFLPVTGERRSRVMVGLERERTERETRVKLGVRMMGIDEAGLEALLEPVEEAVARRPDLAAEINAQASVPFGHVIGAVDALLGAGIEEIMFTGVAMPRPR
ncbi:MAG: hypothetical protein ACYS99_08800 [Planctomycetota bacterium]